MVILLTLGKAKIDGHFADFGQVKIDCHFDDFGQVKIWWVVFPLILILE